MTDTNLAPWGLWVVPLGLAICFGPALIVWLRAELKAGKVKGETPPPQLDSKSVGRDSVEP